MADSAPKKCSRHQRLVRFIPCGTFLSRSPSNSSPRMSLFPIQSGGILECWLLPAGHAHVDAADVLRDIRLVAANLPVAEGLRPLSTGEVPDEQPRPVVVALVS